MTLKGQYHDPNMLRAQYLENSWRCSLKSQHDVRAAGEQNKSVVTDHATCISLKQFIDWDQAKVIDRECNRVVD